LLQSHQNYTCNIFVQVYNRLASILEGTQAKNNISVLDGIRAIACLSVVMFHINLITTNDIALWVPKSTPSLFSALAFSGDTGVTLFFVLSGFLLFLPYAKSLLFDGTWPSVRQFYVRRILRILPVYYLSLIIMVFLFHPQYLQADRLKQWILFLTMFMDSSATTYKQINGPFWTLAVEWQFYLLLPWMALAISWLVKHITPKKRFFALTICLSVIATWGILTRFLGVYLTTHPQTNIILPHAIITHYILPFIYGPAISGLHGKFLEDFAVGMFASSLYIMAQKLPEEHHFHLTMKKISPWLFISAISLFIIMAMWKLNTSQPHTWGIFDSLNYAYNVIGEFGFALSYGLFVTSIVFGYTWLRQPFEWKPLRWIGLLSYTIYMWHLLLLEKLTPFVSTLSSAHHLLYYGIYWLGLFLIVVPLAFLFFICVEKPGIRLGKNYRPVPLKLIRS
jgi:peptidoglycan/LPS O-acetylase OafA/YrhL